MRKNVLVFGLIGGLIVSALMLILISFNYNDSELMENSMWLGYATMLIAFSMIFVGVKNYRDKYNDGVISFGKALKLGLLITLVASTIYVITWQIEYRLFFPEFMDRYVDLELAKMKSDGLSEQEINEGTAEMMKMKEMMKNPVINILFTYLEILPVGVIVSLFCALILKRKKQPVDESLAI